MVVVGILPTSGLYIKVTVKIQTIGRLLLEEAIHSINYELLLCLEENSRLETLS
jgi:hypothetical protein